MGQRIVSHFFGSTSVFFGEWPRAADVHPWRALLRRLCGTWHPRLANLDVYIDDVDNCERVDEAEDQSATMAKMAAGQRL